MNSLIEQMIGKFITFTDNIKTISMHSISKDAKPMIIDEFSPLSTFSSDYADNERTTVACDIYLDLNILSKLDDATKAKHIQLNKYNQYLNSFGIPLNDTSLYTLVYLQNLGKVKLIDHFYEIGLNYEGYLRYLQSSTIHTYDLATFTSINRPRNELFDISSILKYNFSVGNMYSERFVYENFPKVAGFINTLIRYKKINNI